MSTEIDCYRFNKAYLNALDKIIAHINTMGGHTGGDCVTEFLNMILYPLNHYYKVGSSTVVPTYISISHVARLHNTLTVKQPGKVTLDTDDPIHYIRVISDFYTHSLYDIERMYIDIERIINIEYMDINIECLIYTNGGLRTVEGRPMAFNKYLFHRHHKDLVQICRYMEKWNFMNL